MTQGLQENLEGPEILKRLEILVRLERLKKLEAEVGLVIIRDF